jgi:hypothetical protein
MPGTQSWMPACAGMTRLGRPWVNAYAGWYKTIKSEQIEGCRKELAQDLAYSDRIGREEVCHPAPGP